MTSLAVLYNAEDGSETGSTVVVFCRLSHAFKFASSLGESLYRPVCFWILLGIIFSIRIILGALFPINTAWSVGAHRVKAIVLQCIPLMGFTDRGMTSLAVP
jgi:hypothetical protein